MKSAELKEMPVNELEKLLEDKKEALFNFRFQNAKRILPDSNKLKETKKDIARIYTFLQQKKDKG